LGRVSVYIIRESSNVEKTSSDLNGFTFELVSNLEASIRAVVAAMGGNAVCGCRIDEFLFDDTQDAQDEAYCLVSMSGDAFLADTTAMSSARDSILMQVWDRGSRWTPAMDL
jgi:hypothetical protein